MAQRRLRHRSARWADHTGYSLAWEYLGGRYNRMIQEQGLSLEQLERALTGDSLRWLPIETLETDDEEVIRTLDRECHVPRSATVLVGDLNS